MAFVCQECHKVLSVEQSLQALLSFSQSPFPPPGNKDARLQADQKEVLRLLGDSFVVVPSKEKQGKQKKQQQKPDEEGATNTNWDQQITACTKLFELASDKTLLDHPLCERCAASVHEICTRQLKETQQQKEDFGRLLKELEARGERRPSARKQRVKAHAKMEAELEQMYKERKLLQVELGAADAEAARLEGLELGFWREYVAFQAELEKTTRQHAEIVQRIDVATEELERLRRTNVYDDAFHIHYDGHFGTINGFRLGFLPSQPVEWVEINAALGQVILLLHTVAAHCKFRFAKYVLHPMGSFSKISKVEDPEQKYELYGLNDLSLGRLFWYKRFDTGLVWLLGCIQEFGDFAHKTDHSFLPRYRIKGDTVEGLSIKRQFNQDEKWTRALKYMLTNLKFLLAWTSKHQGRFCQ